MGKFVDITGNRFGVLTVLGPAGRDHRANLQWHCHCDCGREIIRSGNRLSAPSLKIQSCGWDCGLRQIADTPTTVTPAIPLHRRPVVPRPERLPGLRGKAARIQELEQRLWQTLLDRGLIREA